MTEESLAQMQAMIHRSRPIVVDDPAFEAAGREFISICDIATAGRSWKLRDCRTGSATRGR